MKLHKLLLSLAVCGISFSSFANVTLNLPNSAELILVNGNNAEGNSQQILKNGTNQIAFRYNTNYRENGDSHLFNSEVIIVTFAGTNTTYNLQLPKILNNLQAQNFNDSPMVQLTTTNGAKIPFKQDVLIKNGFQINRDYQQEIAQYNLSHAKAALPSAIAINEITPLSQQVSETKKDGQIDQAYVAKMLNYWYEKANQDTRTQFKNNIAK